MPRRSTTKLTKEKTTPLSSYWDQVTKEVQSNQSKLSLVLGALIVLVVGILIFNYFNKNKASLGPAQQTQQQEDVSADKLPGKYTVKEGDTLFTIAEKYYQDGNKFTEIAKVNNMGNVDMVVAGQVLEIPKLEVEVSTSPSPSPEISSTPTATGTGGGNTTIWGSRIEENTYTIQEGDWLSKIAGRAYGDVYSFQKIAQANNIVNPDLIYPGQVLTIPR